MLENTSFRGDERFVRECSFKYIPNQELQKAGKAGSCNLCRIGNSHVVYYLLHILLTTKISVTANPHKLLERSSSPLILQHGY